MAAGVERLLVAEDETESLSKAAKFEDPGPGDIDVEYIVLYQ